MPTKSSPLFVGAASSSYLNAFCGRVHDVRVYNRALPTVELRGLWAEMSHKLQASDAPPLALCTGLQGPPHNTPPPHWPVIVLLESARLRCLGAHACLRLMLFYLLPFVLSVWRHRDPRLCRQRVVRVDKVQRDDPPLQRWPVLHEPDTGGQVSHTHRAVWCHRWLPGPARGSGVW